MKKFVAKIEISFLYKENSKEEQFDSFTLFVLFYDGKSRSVEACYLADVF
jgi:hypothetical protein